VAKKKSTKKARTTRKKSTGKTARKAAGKSKASSKKKTTRSKKSSTKRSTKKKSTKKKSTTKKSTSKKKPKKKKSTKKKSTKKSTTKKKSTKKSTTKKKPSKKTSKRSARSGTVVDTGDNGKQQPRKFLPDRDRPWAFRRADADEVEHKPLSKTALKKVKTGLSRKDLQQYKQELLIRRAEILEDTQSLNDLRSMSDGDISRLPLHMADAGSDSYEQEFTLGLMESERQMLVEIDEALERIAEGTYGVCIESGKPIGRPRLDAKPWAKYCIEVAREKERHQRY